MRILQILPELNVGGVETGTVDFAKYLKQHGHHAVVVSYGGELVQELRKSGIQHYSLPVHEKNFVTMFQMVKAVREIIVRENVDIVHARSRVPAWIAYFACRRTNATLITTGHGHYQNRWFSQVMGWSKLVIVPSEVIGRHMIDTFHVSSRNIRCIHRSVDLTRFHLSKPRPTGKSTYTISILGRITPLKGHIYFIKAIAKVVRQMPHVRVNIIGDAPAQKKSYKKELELLVQQLGLGNVIHFLGNRRDIPELLAETDVLVLPTITPEAFGRVILEAQAMDVPVVATSVGGIIEIIDHEQTGLLVPPKDENALADAILRLLKDRPLAQRIIVAAKKKLLDHYTLDHMASRTVKVYEEILKMTNILVIKLSSLGDVVLITAALKAIRQKFPEAKIYCLTGKEGKHVLQNCPYLDGVILFDANDRHRGWFGLIKLTRKLRKYRFDKVIDLQNNRKSHLLSYLSFPKESYGYRNAKWGSLLSEGIDDSQQPMAAVPHQFQILNQLGILMPEHPLLELWPSDKEKGYVQELLAAEWLADSKQIVGINIAASAKWQTKNWPLEHMARLCDLLASKGIRVFITGMDKDRALGQQLQTLTKSKPALFIGKTNILQLAALIKTCNVFITPDSAPLHVAAAMHVPTIALFGPTSSVRHVPPAETMVIHEKKLKCTPCYSPRCRIMTHACMQDIRPEEILRSIEQIMGGRES